VRARDFMETAFFCENAFQLRIVIKDINRSLMLVQRLSEVSQCTAQTRFRKGIEQIKHKRPLWEGETGGVPARAFY